MAITWPDRQPLQKKKDNKRSALIEKLVAQLNCLIISSHLSLKMISELKTWFPENRVKQVLKGECWEGDSCKISNLGHIFLMLYHGESEVLSDRKIAGQLRKNSSGHATRFFFKKSQNFEIPAIMAKNLWVCAKSQHCRLRTVKKIDIN